MTIHSQWTATDTVRLAGCIFLAGVALVSLAVDFGWVGLAVAVLAVLFIAVGMAS